MRTTLPAASIASLLSSSTFSINILNVRQVVASGGLTTEHFSHRMAARKLRPGKECSFVNKENADKFEKNEVDSDILKECSEVEACVKDATSSLGGRCVASTMASASQVIMLTSGSCAGNCGIIFGINGQCNCDDRCLEYGDCCSDYCNVCNIEDERCPSQMPSVSVKPSLSQMPSASVKPSQMPSVSVKPSQMPSVSVKPSLEPSVSVKPSKRPSVSAKPSQMPSVTVKPSMIPS